MNFQKATTTIKDFEYKESVEKERPLLTAEPRLITIDGVDGREKHYRKNSPINCVSVLVKKNNTCQRH